MIKKLTLLTAAILVYFGVFSQQYDTQTERGTIKEQQNDVLKNSYSMRADTILMHTDTVTTCNAIFYDSGGETGGYVGRESYTLTILPATPNSQIVVTFLEVNIDARHDYLEVHNGTSTSSPLVATLRGTSVPAEPFYGVNPEGALTFYFYSNAWYHADGWKATVECFPLLPKNLMAIKLNTAASATANEPKTVPFVISNKGTESVLGSQYTVQLQDAANNVLATANGVDLIPEERTTINIMWTPTTVGPVSVKGVIIFGEDNQPENNATELTTFTVYPEGTYITQIGTDSVLLSTLRIPFDFFWKNSFCQTIYLKEDIGIVDGTIVSIAYKYSFEETVGSKGVRVWIGETTQSDLSSGLIDPNTLTLVYQGNLDFPSGVQDLMINLQTPYVYGGNNLVVYTYREMDEQTHGANNTFYLTDVGVQRTRSNQNNFEIDPLSPSYEGALSYYSPNITLYFSTVSPGSISGNVTCDGNPVEGVTVQIVGGTQVTATDTAGNYALANLQPATYNLKFSKYGYTTAIEENIQVNAGANTVVDVTLSPINQFMVSGTVTASDTGEPLEGIVVNLTGEVNYTSTTDSSGHYLILDVLGLGRVYEISAETEGYQPYTETITVANADITHDIALNEIPYPAKKVFAEINEPNVNVTWSDPLSGPIGDPQWIHWDSGENDEGIGTGGDINMTIAQRFSVANLQTLGVVDMSVTKVKFFPREAGTYTVKIWTGGSAIDPGTLVHEQVADNIVVSQWNEVVLTTPVTIPAAEELWFGVNIQSSGYPAGCDAGPAITGFGDLINMGSGWQTLLSISSELDCNWNLAAYVDDAKGVETKLSLLKAEYEMNVQKANIGNDRALATTTNTVSLHRSSDFENSTSTANNASRVFIDYSVYRLVRNQPQAEWTELTASTTDTSYTDTGWGTLPANLYQYAVVANYSNNVASAPTLSNILAKDMEAEFTLNIATNSNDPVVGAIVTLTNHDGNSEHAYQALVGTPEITFPAVWKGVYTITVTMENFEPFVADSVVINSDTTYSVTLIEIIKTPFNLEINQDGNDEIFTWNNGVTVILEAHDVWNDGTGYQLLLDADADQYGQTIPVNGNMYETCGAPANLYDVFEYMIPENADPVCTTQNIVVDGEVSILIPAGTYDYCIVNPVPGDKLYIAGGENARKDDYVFESGKTYRFLVEFGGFNDQVTIIITDDDTGKIVNIEKFGNQSVDETLRSGEGNTNQINSVSMLNIGDYYPGAPNKPKSFSGYTVYLDDEEVASGIMDETYTFENVSDGTHTAGVKAVYTSGSSEMVTIEFTHEALYNVTFKVIRSDNSDVIAGATITVGNESVSESATTDADGIAMFELPGGTYNWIFTKDGWETFEGTATITDHTEILVIVPGIKGNDIQSVMLYPNPATSTLTIKRKSTTNAMVELYSNSGVIVNSFEMNEAIKEISVSDLNSGVYFIRIIENETTTIQRFIKQ